MNPPFRARAAHDRAKCLNLNPQNEERANWIVQELDEARLPITLTVVQNREVPGLIHAALRK
jgi:hypothetical protein